MLSIFVVDIYNKYLSNKRYLKIFVTFVRQNVVNFSILLVNQQEISENFCYIYFLKCQFFMLVLWHKISSENFFRSKWAKNSCVGLHLRNGSLFLSSVCFFLEFILFKFSMFFYIFVVLMSHVTSNQGMLET